MNKLVTILRESRVARFLIPAGLILIAAGILFFVISLQSQNYLPTEATVLRVEEEEDASANGGTNSSEVTYHVDIKYTVDGKEYENDLGGVSKFEVGDKMKIFYNPENPAQITQSKSLIIPIAIIAAGIAALVGGIVSGVNAIKRYQRMQEQEKEWSHGN
ncbi:MAG: DUF3592 domain-containing protein [Lachnospiraceae bacterium]|nr:DUF3592 domain-containing protein [Lachnospiraceae bacterium]